MTATLKPLVPGQAYHPDKRAGPATVRATSSGRGYPSVAALEMAVLARRDRGHSSPDIEAFQLFPDLSAGKVYAVPCALEDERAYRLHQGRRGRDRWLRLSEVYDAFNMQVPSQMYGIMPVMSEVHPTLGHCVSFVIKEIRLRPLRRRAAQAP